MVVSRSLPRWPKNKLSLLEGLQVSIWLQTVSYEMRRASFSELIMIFKDDGGAVLKHEENRRGQESVLSPLDIDFSQGPTLAFL